jgi:hypothetical protein
MGSGKKGKGKGTNYSGPGLNWRGSPGGNRQSCGPNLDLRGDRQALAPADGGQVPSFWVDDVGHFLFKVELDTCQSKKRRSYS